MSIAEICSEFTFVWKIKNINNCLIKKGEKLTGPVFEVQGRGEWQLVFYPYGNQATSVEFVLKVISSSSNADTFSCHFCVCNSEQKLLYSEGKELDYTNCNSNVVARFEREILDVLQDDPLLFHCHMWNNASHKIENPVHFIAETRIIQRKNIFHWKIENFSTLQFGEERKINGSLTFPNINYRTVTVSITLKLFLSGKSLTDALIELRLYFEGFCEHECYKASCALNVMDENKKTKKYIRGEYWLGSVVNVVKISFMRSELMAGGLTNDVLLLQGNVDLSFNDGYGYEDNLYCHSEVCCVYGLQTNEAINATEMPSIPAVSETLPSIPPSTALPLDMLSLFKGNGPPSDFELRVAGNSFPVHKLILEARSTVFKAMFASNMQETTKGSLELTDIDVGTAERMLLYVYTDKEPSTNLSHELLIDLYEAADKYALSGLSQICAKRLARDLDLNNAPRVLQISDRHSDPLLKKEVMDFFVSQGLGAIESENWKNLEGDDPKLANEVMHKIIYHNHQNKTADDVTNPKKRGRRAGKIAK